MLITVRGGCIQRLLLCLSDSAKTVLRAFMKRVACIDTCRVHSPVRLHRTHHHHEAKELLLLEAATAIKASKRTIQGMEHQQKQSLQKPGFVGLGLGFEAWIRICLQALTSSSLEHRLFSCLREFHRREHSNAFCFAATLVTKLSRFDPGRKFRLCVLGDQESSSNGYVGATLTRLGFS